MRDTLFICGCLLATGGLWLAWPPAALVAAGLGLALAAMRWK